MKPSPSRPSHLFSTLWYLCLALLLSVVALLAWRDYAWFARQQQQIPGDARLSTLEQSSSPWRPWSLITPVVTGFTLTQGPFEAIEHDGDWLLEIHHSQFSAPATAATQRSIRVLRCSDGLFALRDSQEQAITLGLLSEEDPLLEFCELL